MDEWNRIECSFGALDGDETRKAVVEKWVGVGEATVVQLQREQPGCGRHLSALIRF